MKHRILGVLLALPLVAGLLSLASPPANAALTPEETWATAIINGTQTNWQLNACSASTTCLDILAGTNIAQDTVGTDQSLTSANSQLGSEAYTSKGSDCPRGSINYFTARWWPHKGTLGNTNYRWHWAVWYCRNANTAKITKWLAKKDWVTNAAWYVDVKEIVTTNMNPNTNDGMPVSTATAYRERHVQLNLLTSMVPLNFYPNGKFWLFGNGGVGVEGSAR